MMLVPTLNFGGNCHEAILMYQKAFQGKVQCMITYREADDPMYNPLLKDGQRDYIYHAELLIGEKGIVLETIDNLNATGQVQVRGQEWMARSREEGVVIPKDAVVTIFAIEGVKLIVTEKETEKETDTEMSVKES